MYAVMTTFRWERQPDPAVYAHLREHIVPNVSRAPGFVAGYWTGDDERNYNTLVFATREAAEAMATDIRGNVENQAKAGLVAERIVVAEVAAHATAPAP
jgi:hypothetical protein